MFSSKKWIMSARLCRFALQKTVPNFPILKLPNFVL